MSKVKALANSTEFEPQASSLRWAAIREDYIAQNMRREKGQPAYRLPQLAAAHKVNYHYLRQICGTQKWNAELKRRVEERTRAATETLKGVSLFNELEIRTRQATYARLASSLAHKKLLSIKDDDVKKLTIKDAIELLKIGLGEERQALGIGDTVRVPQTTEERVLSDSQLFAVARRVIELRQHDDGVYSTDASS